MIQSFIDKRCRVAYRSYKNNEKKGDMSSESKLNISLVCFFCFFHTCPGLPQTFLTIPEQKFQEVLGQLGTSQDVLPDNLDMVDFVAKCSIHAIKIGFQKYYILPGKCCP